jgi:hypothetical protein
MFATVNYTSQCNEYYSGFVFKGGNSINLGASECLGLPTHPHPQKCNNGIDSAPAPEII